MDVIEIESDDSSKSTPRKRRRKSKREMRPKRELRPKIEMEVSGPPPRTRSKAAPEWTTRESIVLVNEISAIEGDCLKVLSTLQKWKIIVDHCNQLGVRRTLDQCKGKWNSLIQDYNKIKQWDSKSDSDPYWVLDCETRKQFQLPLNFDNDLFDAIDNHVGAQQDDSDTGAEHEDGKDLLEVIADSGPKRKRRKSISQNFEPEEEPQKSLEEVNPQTCSESDTSKEKCVEQEPLETHLGENEVVYPRTCSESEIPKEKDVGPELVRSHLDENEEVNPQMCSQSEAEVKNVEQEHRGSNLDEANPQTCFESKSLQEPRESHYVKNDEANPQMYPESETSKVQYGEQEPQGSHLDKNVEINPQIYSQSEIPLEQFGQRSHLEENDSKSQLGFESETLQVRYSEKDPRGSDLEEVEETNHEMPIENVTPREQYSEQKPQENHLEENPHEPSKSTINVEEETQKSPKNKSKKIERPRKKKIMGEEDEEKRAVNDLYQNAKLILDVVKGDLRENGATNTMSAQNSQPDFARGQGDSLIAYLGKIVSILDKFPHLVQESK